jgi:hypothetical protein
MHEQNKVRSYVFGFPSTSQTQLPKIKQKIGSKPRLNQVKIQRLNSHNTYLSCDASTAVTDEISSKHTQKNVSHKFLPYIYAQNGSEYLKNVLRNEGSRNNADSLPLVRKEYSLNLVPQEEIEQEKFGLRVRSVEFSS